MFMFETLGFVSMSCSVYFKKLHVVSGVPSL